MTEPENRFDWRAVLEEHLSQSQQRMYLIRTPAASNDLMPKSDPTPRSVLAERFEHQLREAAVTAAAHAEIFLEHNAEVEEIYAEIFNLANAPKPH